MISRIDKAKTDSSSLDGLVEVGSRRWFGASRWKMERMG